MFWTFVTFISLQGANRLVLLMEKNTVVNVWREMNVYIYIYIYTMYIHFTLQRNSDYKLLLHLSKFYLFTN